MKLLIPLTVAVVLAGCGQSEQAHVEQAVAQQVHATIKTHGYKFKTDVVCAKSSGNVYRCQVTMTTPQMAPIHQNVTATAEGKSVVVDGL